MNMEIKESFDRKNKKSREIVSFDRKNKKSREIVKVNWNKLQKINHMCSMYFPLLLLISENINISGRVEKKEKKKKKDGLEQKIVTI